MLALPRKRTNYDAGSAMIELVRPYPRKPHVVMQITRAEGPAVQCSGAGRRLREGIMYSRGSNSIEPGHLPRLLTNMIPAPALVSSGTASPRIYANRNQRNSRLGCAGKISVGDCCCDRFDARKRSRKMLPAKDTAATPIAAGASNWSAQPAHSSG